LLRFGYLPFLSIQLAGPPSRGLQASKLVDFQEGDLRQPRSVTWTYAVQGRPARLRALQ
jgi:hypothetical protein